MPNNRVLCVLIGLSMMIFGCRSSGAVNALELERAATPVAPASAVMSLLSATNVQTETTSFGVPLTANPQSSAATLFRPSFGGPEAPMPDEPQPSTVSEAATP